MSADTMVERLTLLKPLRRFAEVYTACRGMPWIGVVRPEQAFDQAADLIERLEAEKRLCVEALEFYANEWEQDVDAERTITGWTGTIGEIQPTIELLHDAGAKARTTLSAVGEIRD